MADETEVARPSQDAVFAAPTFFVDGNLGTATGGGVARVTLAAYKLNVDREASMPSLQPVVTIAVPERSLLAFAHEMIARAEQMGITLEDDL